MLEKFLKFTTGSSKLPYETNSFHITVYFKKNANIKSLPIAHTCSLNLEVQFFILNIFYKKIPMYKSYEMLKKMCDIAFNLGIEGFGLA